MYTRRIIVQLDVLLGDQFQNANKHLRCDLNLPRVLHFYFRASTIPASQSLTSLIEYPEYTRIIFYRGQFCTFY